MERTSRHDGFWKGFSIVLLVVLVALVGMMWYQSRQPRYIYHEGGNPVTRTLASLTAPGGSSDIYWVADLAEKSLPYVVNITSIVKPTDQKKSEANSGAQSEQMLEQMQQMLPFGSPFNFQMPENHPPIPREGKVGEGSGFIFREDGYVVTNAHVTDSGDNFKVRTNDGKEYDADLIGTDDFKDIAVLKIKGGGTFPAAVLGESTKTRIGEPVIAIGSPLGLKASVTAGIISTTERTLSDIDNDKDVRKPQKYLQTDAAINRGNSGGPLINSHGEVIGINQAIVRWDGNAAWTGGGMVPIEGVGFAIAIDEVKNTIAQIVEHGKVVYPGISANIMGVADFIEENKRGGIEVKLHAKKGVYVQSVTVNGPADKAGIQANDVILSINDKPVETGEELITEIGKYKVGDRVRMRVARQGGEKQEDVSVVLGALDIKNRPRR